MLCPPLVGRGVGGRRRLRAAAWRTHFGEGDLSESMKSDVHHTY